MSKKRRRSEVSEASSGEFSSVSKRQCQQEWTVPRDLNTETELCTKLLNFLRKYRDNSDSCLSDHLLRAPSRRSQPDYYDVISNPIDLFRIQQKVKTNNYKTVQDFLSDVKLLFDNINVFYSPSSDEFKAAVNLKSVFHNHLAEFGFCHRTGSISPVSSLTLRIPKVQLPSLRSPRPLTRSQRMSSSSESSVSTNKSTPTTSKPPPAKSSSGGKASAKGTRSRAWIDEYLGSDDPFKMYLAQVYNHHDSSGDYVAELFHSLPSRKEYPEYYRVISEPIDLSTIKKKIDSGRYSEFKAVQEDMILMIKNAHYFNEPGSVLHKKASTMRKFIISKGAELWRKYQLGQNQIMSDGEGEAKKVPKLSIRKPLEEEVKRQRRQSQLSTSEMDSQSDSSEEDISSDEEGGDKQQFTLRIKTEQLSGKTPTRPLTKLLKAKRPPPLQRVLMIIYRTLTTQTDTGRLVCELFRKRPSIKIYPEYYIVIKQPIDLKEIHYKIKSGAYSSVEGMMTDVELLVSNACTFNEEESLVYTDALILRRAAQEAVEQIQLKWPEMVPYIIKSKSGSSITSEADAPSDVTQLYTAVKHHTDSRGRLLWKSFEKMPHCSTPSEAASKKPVDMDLIDSKVTQGHYPTVDSLLDDLAQLFDNAYCSYSAETTQSKDSIVLHRVAMKKYQQLRAAEREANPVPNVQDCVQKIIKEIVTKNFSYKDASGHCPAESLSCLEANEEFPNPDLPESMVHRILTLPRIREWVCQGKYPRLDQLQKDVLLVLAKGRAEVGGPAHQDAIAMERRWIQIRDEVCKKGSLLWSPALSHTLSDLEAQLALEKSHEPTSPLVPDTGDEEVDVVSGGNQEEEEDEGMLVDKKDAEYVTECECEGVEYQIGDVVYVKARAGSGREPHIVLVESLWRDSTGSMWLDGCWFCRPVETFHPATRKFYEKEVFKSDFRSVAKLTRVLRKCGVLYLKDYTKYHIEGVPEEDTFLCESRYANKAKSFKKIKMWSMPGIQPRLLPRDTPLSLVKEVPSVFAPTAVDEVMEVDVEGEAGEGVDDSGSLLEEEEEQLKLSFSAQLKNITTTTVSNPEPDCTYYEQYCIDNDHFRLGDFVYLRSDQELAYIARIEKMWTDTNDDPWIRGPWFIRPRDVSHTPTRVFYEREVFQSNIQDTNPMRSICGRLAVVIPTDYSKKWPTQYSVDDMLIADSRYNEAEKKIIKLRALKHYQLSESVVLDEVYHFPKEILPIKAPSPKLSSKEYQFVPSPPDSKEASRGSTPSLTAPAVQIVQKQSNVLQLNPQLVQQLLASASKQLVMTTKGSVPMSTIPTSVANSSSSLLSPQTPLSSQQAKQSPTVKAQSCVCHWTDCGQVFGNLLDLNTHLHTIGVHVIADAHGNYYCKWKGCHRNPITGGKPFNSNPKLTRHIREVHLMKISNSLLGLTPLTGAAIAALSTPVPPSTVLTPVTPVTPLTPVTPPTPITSFTPTTPIITPSTQSPPKTAPTIGEMVQAASKTALPTSTSAESSKATSIFHSPPENRQHISHSAIYLKYIRGLQSDSPSLSSYQPTSEVRTTAKPPGPIRPSDWLGSDAIVDAKDNKSIADALWALRDHLLKESSKLERFTKSLDL